MKPNNAARKVPPAICRAMRAGLAVVEASAPMITAVIRNMLPLGQAVCSQRALPRPLSSNMRKAATVAARRLARGAKLALQRSRAWRVGASAAWVCA
ncbi:hypothetical protein D3C78_1540810 [compost metagenome]